jgi:hypothetical protein
MAPEVFRWAAVFGFLLVVVWIGFLIMAVQWLLNHALLVGGVLVVIIGLIVVTTELNRNTSG